MPLPPISQPDLLTKALTHRSALNEKSAEAESYERLEFLGDAVLELLTSEFLFNQYPHQNEGELTAYRSALVRTEMLAKVALEVKLESMVIMGRGEKFSKGPLNTHILADVFEAYLGALFIDQGLSTVKGFLQEQLFPKIETVIAQHSFKDPKSLFQEKMQAKGLPTPFYQVVSESGPDHEKLFVVQVKVIDQVMGEGKGSSKQRAESAAAQNALEQLPGELL